MTAKEKAYDLVHSFRKGIWKHGNPNFVDEYAKECAGLSVDEAINLLQELEIGYDRDYSIEIKWQREIKQELQNL